MNKFICTGMYVVDNKNRTGKVIAFDVNNHIAIIQTHNSFWSEEAKNLKVTSYEEVR